MTDQSESAIVQVDRAMTLAVPVGLIVFMIGIVAVVVAEGTGAVGESQAELVMFAGIFGSLMAMTTKSLLLASVIGDV